MPEHLHYEFWYKKSLDTNFSLVDLVHGGAGLYATDESARVSAG